MTTLPNKAEIPELYGFSDLEPEFKYKPTEALAPVEGLVMTVIPLANLETAALVNCLEDVENNLLESILDVLLCRFDDTRRLSFLGEEG